MRVTPEAREGEVLSVNVPRLKYKPGETVKGFVTYRPFRAAESILPIELPLPRDLPDGTYQLAVGDWTRYLTDEQMAQPFRFSTESIDDVFAVLKDLMSLRHNALYVRLIRQPDGVAVGRVAMPRLPASRRQVLLSSGRSNTTPFVSSTVEIIPTELLMRGSADLSIEISSERRVETASGAGKPRPEHPSQGSPPGDAKDRKPASPPKTDFPKPPDNNKPEPPDKPAENPGDQKD